MDIDRVFPQPSRWQFVIARLMVIMLALACLVMTLRAGNDRPQAVVAPVPVTVIPRTAATADAPLAGDAPASLDTAPAAAWADSPAPDGPVETETPHEAIASAEADTTPEVTAAAPATGGNDDADPAASPSERDIAVGAVASTPPGKVREKYTVSTWRDFTASLDALDVRWGGASGTNRFKIILANDSPDLARTMYVVVYARNDAISPPRRETWPPTVVDDEAYPNPTGGLLSGTIRRNWGDRPDKARGRKLTLGPTTTTAIGASLPLRATCQHEAWEGATMEPVGFIEFLLWVFDEDGNLVFTRRYECLPPARR